ncbi:MAG: HAD family hydrolase [Gemmataceae bacterium]|nr:HAD family hydrolase [Gemmataceae bacterium]
MPRVEAVLLDIDGTLVDSNDAHAHAWLEALSEEGVHPQFADVRRLIGKGGDKLLPEVSGIDAESERGKAISGRRSAIFKSKWLPALKPTPGAKELLQALNACGLRLAVASSAKEDELGPLLRVCGATSLVEARTSSDDADNSKPDPDIVQAALGRLKLPPERVLLLGDTPWDIEAAKKAGVGTVAVRCGGWDDADLKGALAVYADPADLLARLAVSPLA